VTAGRRQSLRNSSVSESCKKKGSRWCVWPCLSAMIFGSRRRWRHPCSAREGMGCRVRSRPSRGRKRCKRKSRERWPTSTKRFAVYPCSGDVPRALLPGEEMGVRRRGLAVRGGVVAKQMSGRGELQRRCGVLFGRGGLGAGCTSTITVGQEGRRFWSGVVG
jgi:hypothetical protein